MRQGPMTFKATARKKRYNINRAACRLRKEEKRQENRIAKIWQRISSRHLYFDRWQSTMRITYDAALLTHDELLQIVQRAGVQIGVGKYSPGDPHGCSLGYGTFSVVSSH